MRRLSLWATLLGIASLACAALAQETRAGIRVQFVTLHSAGGMQGEAFLPISSRRTEIHERADDGPCASGPELVFEGRHPSAYIRSVRVSLRGRGEEHVIGGASCPAAVVQVTLEDGTVVEGGKGSVSVDARSDSEVRGRIQWTPRVAKEPFPLNAEFTVRLPEAR